MLNQTTSLAPEAALDILSLMGIPVPTVKQVEIMTTILTSTMVKKHVLFDERLTPKEQHFLLWVAHGKTIEEAGEFLGITTLAAYDYHNEVRRKLSCRTISQAVFEGLRFGYLPAKQATETNE